MTFEGFHAEAMAFLTELGSEDKAWLDEHKKDYKRLVADPAKSFVVAVGERLVTDIAPTMQAVPKTNGSIGPINNDLRFSPDKTPYKDHLLFRFWDGPDKKVAPTLFVRISQTEIGFATGAALPDLGHWRELIDDPATGEPLVASLAALSKGRTLDMAGQEYKKVPKPYAADHPRADLLRHKMVQARWSEPTPASITKPTFIDWCAKRLDACVDVHQWLVTNL